MKFLEEPNLTWVTQCLNGEVGDQIINGRVEAFSCKLAGVDKKLSKMLETQYTEELASSPDFRVSPFGDMGEQSTRKLMINLIATMNASFPDYDFSNNRPEQFMRERSPNVAMSSINARLADLLPKHGPGFLERMWTAVNEVISINECEVYAYIPDEQGDPFEGNMWTFNYFFYNKTLKKILFFTCMAKSMMAMYDEEEDDDQMSDVDDGRNTTGFFTGGVEWDEEE